VESRQHTGKQVGARNSRRSERESPNLRLGSRGERAPRIGEQRLGAKHVIGQYLPRRSQRRAAPVSCDQLRPELRLERSDVLGHSRLADVETLGCARERTLAGDCREGSKSRLDIHEQKL
jgi:hypothetical protein